MNFINLTPHALTIIEEDGTTVYTLPASGQVARVETTRTVEFVMDGIEVFNTVYGDVTGLSERQHDTAYIVSALVAQAAKRSDVYSPGELVRNEAGQVIGCRGLTRQGA
jgi:hypothetical protein